VKRSWKTALKNAGIRHVRFHDLRHTFNTRLMEAGVLQEIRMALMGHSAGSKIHATYTHIEFPAKRDAIRKLEQWVNQQRKEIKEAQYANSEIARSESNPGPSAHAGSQAGTQTVEEKDARGSGLGTGRKAQGRNLRGGRRDQSQKAAASKVRRSQKNLRNELVR
jgi:hypothetical protein